MMMESVVGDIDEASRPTGAAPGATELESVVAIDVEGMMW